MSEPKIAGVPSEKRAEVEASVASQAAAAAQAAIDAQEAARAAAVRRIEEQRAMESVAERAEPVPPPAPAQRKSAADVDRLLSEASELRARAEAEREKLASLGEEYAERLRREQDRDRVAALRKMGAIAALTDEQLLRLAPAVDAEAVGGRAALDEWRSANPDLFVIESAPSMPSADELIGGLRVKQSANGLYDADYFVEQFRRNLSKVNR